ncbi:protein NRT1/ PTR FAMILY 5.10-like [Senna tora]|uniref:Protein NRT1/ PTR FAMILY 5.10-like n=1 Tax=Senna tora TaxID=362788 RepID=A0A834X2P1_9FABA|nr:protein NRT1/ PTR FAMILY 5.10-like [Senna tora]
MGITERSDDVLRDPEIEEALVGNDAVNGAFDFKGRPVIRLKSGCWRAARFIIGMEMAERVCYFAIQSNLINYLTGQLHKTTAAAAKNVNIWAGTASLLPLFGAFIADSYLGRYRTILIASLIYILGLGLMTLSTILPLSLTKSECQVGYNVTSSCSNTMWQEFVFFLSLYLVAIGQGGHRPCAQAFGADQFDEHHPHESKQRSSFFNWFYFCASLCGLLFLWILNYIQDNISWILGFGIPCLLMIIAFVIFLLGTKTYRFTINNGENDQKKNPFLRMGSVFLAAIRNWGASLSHKYVKDDEAHGRTLPLQSSEQFNFLNKPLYAPNGSNEVEASKAILKLAPIWATSLFYSIVYAQLQTFFIKQGVTLDRTIFPGFDLPSASLRSLLVLAIVISTPIYDRVFVPTARLFTKNPSGITMLQRVGTGLFMSIITMAMAALVEKKRLGTAKEYGLVDDETIPMSVYWLFPQFFLSGIAEIFTSIGLQELFYDQVPSEVRSLGVALYLSIIGVGSFLSSFLIYVIEEVSGKDGQSNWLANDINQAHLDYFYWLLAGLSVVGLGFFILFSKSYTYSSQKGTTLGV